MWLLYQFPLCPFSRKIRLLLSEKNIPFDLVREDPWSASDLFFNLNPAGRTPVIADKERGIVIRAPAASPRIRAASANERSARPRKGFTATKRSSGQSGATVRVARATAAEIAARQGGESSGWPAVEDSGGSGTGCITGPP